jgi:membrane fusion protein (multidrug efflux system)
MRAKDRLYRSALLAVLAALACATGGCGSSGKDPNGGVEIRVPVVTQQVVRHDVDFSATALGTVEAWREVTVSARTSGQVLKLNFDKGDSVSAKPEGADGEEVRPLAELEQEEYRLRWLEAEAALADAKTTFERTQRLLEQGSAVQSEYDTAKAAYDVAQARHDLAKKQLDDTVVYSPIAGTVIAKPVEVGELVAPGTPLATVADVSRVKIVTSVSESDSPYIQTGRVCPVHIDALPGRRFEGTVIYKSIKADPMTRSFPVELEVDNADGALGIGMVARVTFALRTDADVVTVPLDALVYWENVLGVFVVGEDETAEFRALELGERSGDDVVVTGGLDGGEELVVTGQASLRPGSKVKWPQGKPARLSNGRADGPEPTP